jgi:peptidoglycan/xylan/chitin deacetylase (PgdA/CDA1 family)
MISARVAAPSLAIEPAADATSRISLRSRVSNRIAMHVPAEPFRIDSDEPLVSFTFDDAPVSARTNGAAMLDENGIKGTFYVSGGLVNRRTEDWEVLSGDDIVSLHAAGHEIGCHTFSHIRASDHSVDAVRADIERNAAFLHELDPSIRIGNFAYPYGYGSLGAKRALRGHFQSGRSIMAGVNAGQIDLQFLRATPLIDSQLTPGGVERALDVAMAKNGWLIFFTHDVATRPSSYGCSPALLAYAIAAAQSRGIACVSVKEGLRRVGASRSL